MWERDLESYAVYIRSNIRLWEFERRINLFKVICSLSHTLLHTYTYLHTYCHVHLLTKIYKSKPNYAFTHFVFQTKRNICIGHKYS